MKKILLGLLIISCAPLLGCSNHEPQPEPKPDYYWNDSILNFKEQKLKLDVFNSVNIASSTWEAFYNEDCIKVLVDVVDSNIFTKADLGYSDNIEFQIQGFDSAYRLNGYTLDFLCTGNGAYWAKKLSNNNYSINITTGFTIKHNLTPTGYSVEFDINYFLLGATKFDLLGNVRILPALRNSSTDSITNYEEYSELGSTYFAVNSWPVLNAENKFVREDFKEYKLQDLTNNDVGAIVNNLAEVASNDFTVCKTKPGAPAFLVSNWCLSDYGLPQELRNTDFLRAKKNESKFTITKSGFVIFACDASLIEINEELESLGFTKFVSNARDNLTYLATNSADFISLTNYYYKYCVTNEEIHTSRERGIAFFHANESTPGYAWEEEPAYVSFDAVNDEFYSEDNQIFTTGPSIAVTKGGRLFASWSTGGSYEPLQENCNICAISDDNGKTWTKVFVVDNWVNQQIKGKKKAVSIDLNFVSDKENDVIYATYSQRENINDGQSANTAVWFFSISNVDAPVNQWVISDQKYVGCGWNRNSFLKLSDGTFYLLAQYSPDERYSAAYVSNDNGETWTEKTKIYGSECLSYDEPTLVERNDGTLWATFRTKRGNLFESISKDKGKSWSIAKRYFIQNTNTRTCIKRMHSGGLIMVFNNSQSQRIEMTVAVSLDEGKTWHNKLCLYPTYCSYPDLDIDDNDNIHIVFDDGRYKQYQWRTEEDGKVKTWGYIYHYSINENDLLNCKYRVLDVEELDAITRCKEYGEDYIEGDGSEGNPYLIKNMTTWNIISTMSQNTNFEGKYIKLMADIGTVKSNKIAKNDLPFAGNFDGNNHKISVEYSYGGSVANQGLFGHTSSKSIIKNLTVEGSLTILNSAACASGGIVGVSEGTITNCTNKVNISAEGYQVGGIAGFVRRGLIQNCTNYGTISTNSSATGNSHRGIGGIAGRIAAEDNASTTIANCTNYGEILSKGTQIGGIVGLNMGTASYKTSITQCVNEAKISTTSSVGGTSNDGVGGIVGFGEYLNITECTNNGEVISSCVETAGIIGKIASGNIDACINNGNITGQDQVAGIAGRFVGNSSISNCTNNAVITYMTGDNHGQIFGYLNSSTHSNNEENGNVIKKGETE